MSKLVLLFFIPSLAWSVVIPLEKFDQAKLEQLLRRMPSRMIREENFSGFIRRHYQLSGPTFSINCNSDFYGKSIIPSEKKCDVKVSDEIQPQGDEVKINVTDPALVKALFESISYGADIKKSYSNERLNGQSSKDGDYKEIFRYIFTCKKDACDLIFSPKEVI